MYSSKYSQVSKYSPEARKRMQYRSKGKSCGYYMRIVFFFSSLIQSLIIISLVLFLIYGKKQDSASTSRIHDLEESFSRLSIENVALRHQRKNLTTFLNATVTEKARCEWDLARLRDYTNTSVVLIQDMERRMLHCTGELMVCKSQSRFNGQCPQPFPTETCNCGLLMEQMRARLELVQTNFTQTVQKMKMEMDQITKERDNLNLEAIHLRRDKSTHEKVVEVFREKCKEDFSQSLSGVSTVSKAFREKIESLFPSHIPFQLTCTKQREHLEQIRTNCSSLSREVEDRFQSYLNTVGEQVSSIQSESSRMKAENWRLTEDYRWCSQNRTALIQQHKQSQLQLQLKHDQDKEKLLIGKMVLQGELDIMEKSVKYKVKEVEHLVDQIKHLNMTCTSRIGFSGGLGGGFGGGQQPRGSGGYGTGLSGGGSSSSQSSSSSFGQVNKPVSGSSSSYGSPYNSKPNTANTASSSSSFPSRSSNTGYGSNKPASSGSGSSSSSHFPSGSSSSLGSGSSKPASSGGLFGSSASSSSLGSGSSKPASSGGSFGSSASSSSSGSGSSKPASSGGLFGSSASSSSSGSGSSKPASSGGSFGSTGSSSSSSSIGRGSSTLGSASASSAKSPSASGSSPAGSSASSGTASKSGSSSGWFNSWGSSSSSGQSKTGTGTGTGTGKATSSGTGSFGSGNTRGLGGGTAVSVAQHLRDLQRLINPAAPEEKQDLSRMLG